MSEGYSDEVKNLMQQSGFTPEDIEMLEALKKMEEGWDDITNEGWGLIEGYSNFTEGYGLGIDLNPIST